MAIEREDKWFFEETASKDRLRADDEPTQSTFEDLVASKVSKTEKGSRATTSNQGLVKQSLATDIQSRTSGTDGYAYTIKPENIPTVEAYNNPFDPSGENSIVVTETFDGAKSKFKVGLVESFKTWLYKRLVPITSGIVGDYLAKGAGETLEWKSLSGLEPAIPSGTPNDLLLGDKTFANKYTTLKTNGGTTNQVLSKDSDVTGDYSWSDLDTDIVGGTTGQILKKNSNADGDYGWDDNPTSTAYTFDSGGLLSSLIASTSTTEDFKTKGIGIDVAGTSNKFSIGSTSSDVYFTLNNPEGDDLQVVESSVSWGASTPATPTFYGWIQHLVDTGGVAISNRIVVNQSNVATTLGGTIDSTKEYFIDGIIDLGTTQITVPIGGMNIKGTSFDISGLTSSEDNYTMFISESMGVGSGSLLGSDYFISATGAGSKVYELYDATGFNAFEFSRVNYNDCTSLGDLFDYRQGLEFGTGRFGGSPSLTLHGLWRGGFRVTTSIVRGLAGTMTEPIFKEGTLFQMNSRFLTDINVDLPTLAPLLDFTVGAFPNSSTIQLKGCQITRDGVYTSEDANITPNLSPSDLPCSWKENNGTYNTFVGGSAIVLTTQTTGFSQPNQFEDLLAGSWLSNDLQHFEMSTSGKLKHLGDTPLEFEFSFDLIIKGNQNEEISVMFYKRDSSLGTDIPLNYTIQKRVINNFQGGGDAAFFSGLYGTTLSKNDELYVRVANGTSSNSITVEPSSFFRIQER